MKPDLMPTNSVQRVPIYLGRNECWYLYSKSRDITKITWKHLWLPTILSELIDVVVALFLKTFLIICQKLSSLLKHCYCFLLQWFELEWEIFYPKLQLNSCSAFRVLGNSAIPYFSWGYSVIPTFHRMGLPSENATSSPSFLIVPPLLLNNNEASKQQRELRPLLFAKWVGSLTSPS